MTTPIKSTTVSDLVNAWLSGDAQGSMYDATIGQPETAWQAILEILKCELTDDERALLAAGPMEDLLVHHGPTFIDRVEAESNVNARLNHLLGGVWRGQMPPEVWKRIEKTRKQTW